MFCTDWGGSKSWCTLGHPSFVFHLHGVVARVGVPLATHLLVTTSYVGLLQELVYPWPPIFWLLPMWGGSKSWCTLGHPSFVFNLYGVGGSKSWCTLGHSCLVVCEMVILVCEGTIRLWSNKPIK